MGILDSITSLFSPSKSSTTTQQNNNWTPQQQALFSQIYGVANQGLNKATPSYPGQMYAGVQPAEQNYFSFMGGENPQGQAYQTAMGNLMSGKPSYEINPETTEKAWQQIRQPLVNEFQNVTLPMLNEQYAGNYHSGGFNTGREGANYRAITDFGDTLATKHGELLMNDETARRQALTDASNRVTGAGEAYTGQMGTAGQYARSIEQEKVSGDLQRWLMGEEVGGKSDPSRNAFMQYALALLGLQPYSYSSNSTSSGAGLGYSAISGFAQGLGSSFGMGKPAAPAPG